MHVIAGFVSTTIENKEKNKKFHPAMSHVHIMKYMVIVIGAIMVNGKCPSAAAPARNTPGYF